MAVISNFPVFLEVLVQHKRLSYKNELDRLTVAWTIKAEFFSPPLLIYFLSFPAALFFAFSHPRIDCLSLRAHNTQRKPVKQIPPPGLWLRFRNFSNVPGSARFRCASVTFPAPFRVHIHTAGDTQSRAALLHDDGWAAPQNLIIAFDPPPPVMVFDC